MPKIKVFFNTGFAGCKHEEVWDYDDDEWNDLTEEEQEQVLDQYANDFLVNEIDFGASVVEE